MDSFRDFPSEVDTASVDQAAVAEAVAAAIGTDERRMHVRAYNYWVSLLEGRDFPSIEDLEPEDLQDFSTHSVLLDFTCGRDNPAIAYVGGAIRDECALDEDVRTIADVPSRSLLSRLTDHYMQIIANRAPVGFEAEFDNPRGESICYRGILMPFSSDGDTIDFIYGVINWKLVKGSSPAILSAELPEVALQDDEVNLTFEQGPAVEETLTGPTVLNELLAPLELEPVVEVDPLAGFAIEPEPEDDSFTIEVDEDAGLADRLWAARETAESVKAGEGRTRSALYRALSLAYDFAVASQNDPDGYAELLEESGMKAQTRAPMTPIVKLVFGIDYDKARLTEFAAALSFGHRQQIAQGEFQTFIEAQAGGLKALVAAERQARRPDPAPAKSSETARAKLRGLTPISLAEVTGDDEFAVILTRRGADGQHEPIALLDDPALIERAIRKAA